MKKLLTLLAITFTLTVTSQIDSLLVEEFKDPGMWTNAVEANNIPEVKYAYHKVLKLTVRWFPNSQAVHVFDESGKLDLTVIENSNITRAFKSYYENILKISNDLKQKQANSQKEKLAEKLRKLREERKQKLKVPTMGMNKYELLLAPAHIRWSYEMFKSRKPKLT